MENDADDATSVSSTPSPTLETSSSSPVVHNRPHPIKIESSSQYENDPNSSGPRSQFSVDSSVDPSFLGSKKSTPATTPGSASYFQKPVQVVNASEQSSSQNPASDSFSPILSIPSHPANSGSAPKVTQNLPSLSPHSNPAPGTPKSVHVVPGPSTQALPTSSVSQSDVAAHSILRNQLLPQSSLNNSQGQLLSPQANMHTSSDAYPATSGTYSLPPVPTSPQHVHSPPANNMQVHATRSQKLETGSESPSKKRTALKAIGNGLKKVAKLVGYGIEYVTLIPVNDIVAFLAVLFEPKRKSKRMKLRKNLQSVLEGDPDAPYDKVIKELKKAKKSQRKWTKESTLLKAVIEMAVRQKDNAAEQSRQASQAAQPAVSPIQSAVQGRVPVNSHGVSSLSMSGLPPSAAQQPTSMASYHGVSADRSSGTHSAPSPTLGAHHNSSQKPLKMGGRAKKVSMDIASQIFDQDSD
ncbi:hypothetical protein H0H92_006829 [Tricholoma furcatifolium]|nr:hypothetical protein H0H92_006829 [Tricholoma furcatifolium]